MGSSFSPSSLQLACISSLLISGVILLCVWCFRSSITASLCSELTWPLYLWTKVKSAWCHKTGSCLFSFRNLKKWNTTESTTRYGRAYFLSKRILKKIEQAPLYSISAILSMTAAECNIGIERLASMLPIIVAIRRVHSPLSHKGSKKPTGQNI